MIARSDLGNCRPLSNRDWLRRATKNAHQAAETSWFADGRFPCQATYQRWLHALLRAHLNLGARATMSLGLRRYAEVEVARRNALCGDLRIAAVETRVTQPKPTGWGWGVLYALNGSSLGASLILKSGSIQEGWPTSYLLAMRNFAKSGQLKEFFDRLDKAADCTDEMREGANDVFCSLAEPS